MSHFYGTLQGNRGEGTRTGSKDSGLRVAAASWAGSVRVYLWHDKGTGKDMYRVKQDRWQGAGVQRLVAEGVLGE